MDMKIVMLTTICSVATLSADPYYGQSSCPNGNCSYPIQDYGQNYYQGHSYVQYPSQAYYDSAPSNQYTGGWNGQYQNSQYNTQGGYYNQNQQYNNQGGYYNPNSQSNNPTNNSKNSELNKPAGNYPNQNPAQKNGIGYNNQNNSPYKTQNFNEYDNQSGSINPDIVGYNNKNSLYNRKDTGMDSSTDSGSKPASSGSKPSSSDEPYSYANKPSNSSYAVDKTETKSMKRVSDEEIEKDVHDALSPGWFSSGYPDVTFDVKNGVVNLRGRVSTPDEKTKLEKDVKNIEGVTQVNNEVSVENAKADNTNKKNNSYRKYTADNASKMKKMEADYPKDSALTDSDRTINSKIRNKLSGWFANGYETIIIETSNGNVTITGFVEKPEDIQKINKEARSVEGVKKVTNNVTLKKK